MNSENKSRITDNLDPSKIKNEQLLEPTPGYNQAIFNNINQNSNYSSNNNIFSDENDVNTPSSQINYDMLHNPSNTLNHDQNYFASPSPMPINSGMQNSNKFTSNSFFQNSPLSQNHFSPRINPLINNNDNKINKSINNAFNARSIPRDNYYGICSSTPMISTNTPLLKKNQQTIIPNIVNYSPSQNIKKDAEVSNNSSIGGMDNSSMSSNIPIEHPKLQNIVSTANFGCELNLHDIALQAKNAEYNPKRFAAVIMRIREPKTTALIFKTGKMVCTGAKTVEDSKKAARSYAKIIKSLGFPQVVFKEFKIQNIVGSCDVHFQIDLTSLNMTSKSMYYNSNGSMDKGSSPSNYEPEIFPGLIFHMIEPRIVLLIFSSGKIVLTGAKDKKQIEDAFQNIYPLLLTNRNTQKEALNNSINTTNNTGTTNHNELIRMNNGIGNQSSINHNITGKSTFNNSNKKPGEIFNNNSEDYSKDDDN